MIKSLEYYLSRDFIFSLAQLEKLTPWEKISVSKNLLILANINELRKIDGIALTMHVSDVIACDLNDLHQMPAREKLNLAEALLSVACQELDRHDR